MSRKLTISQYKPFDAVDSSTTQTSAITNVLQNSDVMSIHFAFSQNVSGSFKVEAVNFIPQNPADTAAYDWYELGFSAPLTLTSVPECQIVLNSLPFAAVRFVWTPTSASGTLTGTLVSKTVGA